METDKLKEVLSYCQDEAAFPEVFNIDCGLNIVLPEEKLHSIKRWKDKRRVILNITTFQGMCTDAIHYYGKIEVDGVHLVYDDNPNCSTMINSSLRPLGQYTYDIEIVRKVSKQDIETDSERWRGYRIGMETNCFETIEELVRIFRKICEVRFQGDGWEFLVQPYYSSEPRTLAEMESNLQIQ